MERDEELQRLLLQVDAMNAPMFDCHRCGASVGAFTANATVRGYACDRCVTEMSHKELVEVTLR